MKSTSAPSGTMTASSSSSRFIGCVGPHEREERVGVLDNTHARAAVELLEGVVAVVEIRSCHGPTVLLCAPMALDQVNLGLLVLRVRWAAR